MTEHTYFVACGRGLEPAVVGELQDLGMDSVVEERGGASFRGTQRDAYRACLWLRSAIRVQEELLDTRVHDAVDLYDAIQEIDWGAYLTPEQTLAVNATIRDNPDFSHSGYTALRAKDAIVDQQRERHGTRSSVDTQLPDLPLKLLLQRDRLRLYRDYAGVSLHKRGYRPVQVKSPLNEATAAGLLLLTGWDRTSPLVDPLCGSGTFVIEAALMAADHAPGLLRTFPFEFWTDFDEGMWNELLDEARARRKTKLGFALAGADRHAGAISIAKESAQLARVGELVSFHVAEAATWEPPMQPAFVTTNPPYGERLDPDDEAELEASWRDLGTFLHERCPGAQAWVLSGNKALTRFLRLRATQRIPVRNGPIDCRWIHYELRP